ncbi:Octanoate-[acyl-carrier-protein]-protein-N-octanoyltransferase [Methylophaga thiooxydans]|uniref:Octanoyltransferase n=1 Tax=Methylophaga thiooxydans TaxID=392484 RepID=A0A0A0BHK8_9GAMM|nr:lipoyl(octanoyl) transferase LipB [Methylophaga thiooxydans]KGM07431.1 Octanoate-[acyl-carrier-protein]-protein-N-octanoyltransferase [Methylophaga thiooxydans]
MIIRDLGLVEYEPVVADMREFTLTRDDTTDDQLWLLEHQPVFTQGANGDPAHLVNPHDIPVVNTDRGGQVTYHGPGQLVAYTMIDLRRRKSGVRQMVGRLEQTIIAMLADFDIEAYARQDAPGVYVDERKIASLGLRVKRGACYHGVSFNIDMDLTPFHYINPCGQAGMEVIDLTSLDIKLDMAEAKQRFVAAFQQQMQTGK